MKPYLLAAEVAASLGVTARQVYTLAQDGKVAALRVGDLWRFEARSLDLTADDAADVPERSTVADLAACWRVSEWCVRQCVVRGELVADGGSHPTFSRRAVLRFVIDHTTGDGLEPRKVLPFGRPCAIELDEVERG